MTFTKEKAIELAYFLFEKETKRDIKPLQLEVLKNSSVSKRAYSAFIFRSEEDCPNEYVRDVISSCGSTEQLALDNLYSLLVRTLGEEEQHVKNTIETLEYLLADNKTRLIKLQQLKQETTT